MQAQPSQSGGEMGWKQTLILGGAVLLLAACDSTTAPVANVRDGGAAYQDKKGADPQPLADSAGASTSDLFGCRGSISINSGRIAIATNCTE